METSKESLLMADDSKARDAILFDKMEHISEKIDKFSKFEDRIEKCESDIAVIKGVGATVTALFSGVASWFKFGG